MLKKKREIMRKESQQIKKSTQSKFIQFIDSKLPSSRASIIFSRRFLYAEICIIELYDGCTLELADIPLNHYGILISKIANKLDVTHISLVCPFNSSLFSQHEDQLNEKMNKDSIGMFSIS